MGAFGGPARRAAAGQGVPDRGVGDQRHSSTDRAQCMAVAVRAGMARKEKLVAPSKSQDTIHDSTEAWSPDRAQIKTRNTTLHKITRRKMSPSFPCNSTAAAAMARFCGEIILPSTPPELLPAAISHGGGP